MPEKENALSTPGPSDASRPECERPPWHPDCYWPKCKCGKADLSDAFSHEPTGGLASISDTTNRKDTNDPSFRDPDH